MDLYMHIVSPPARAAYVTAKHLGLDFNVKTTNVQLGEAKTPEYLKMNPSHTIPTLNDNGFVLFESRAIMTYFVNQYKPESPLYPKDPKQRATVDKILYFDASAVFSALAGVLRPKFLRNEDPSQEAIDTLKERISILLELLGEQKFFAGEQLTLADISLGCSLYTLKIHPIAELPEKLKAWYERVSKEMPELHEANQEAVETMKKFMASRKQ